MTLEIFVHDISCEHCKARIEKRVSQLPGVKMVEVDLSRRTVSVQGDVEASAVKRAIAELGYTV